VITSDGGRRPTAAKEVSMATDGGTQPGAPEEPRRAGPDTTVSFSAVTGETEAAEAGLTTDDQHAVEALPAGSALLVVAKGPNAGARFLLDSDRTTAGRHPDSDIFLDDVTVSRKHAEFLREGAGFRLRDVGSLNGTYVNRERVDEHVLAAGDEVQIGKYRMTYHPHHDAPGGTQR
jgi:pSer/pThr/pTyr-binding forkhead associated (FHA) protein